MRHLRRVFLESCFWAAVAGHKEGGGQGLNGQKDESRKMGAVEYGLEGRHGRHGCWSSRFGWGAGAGRLWFFVAWHFVFLKCEEVGVAFFNFDPRTARSSVSVVWLFGIVLPNQCG